MKKFNPKFILGLFLLTGVNLMASCSYEFYYNNTIVNSGTLNEGSSKTISYFSVAGYGAEFINSTITTDAICNFSVMGNYNVTIYPPNKVRLLECVGGRDACTASLYLKNTSSTPTIPTTPTAPPTPAYDDSALKSRISALESSNALLINKIANLENSVYSCIQ